MSELEFLCVDGADPSSIRSPLARALRNAPRELRDASRIAKLEVRGEVAAIDGDVLRITPRRAIVLCDPEAAAATRAALRERFEFVLDVSAALAVLELTGERLLRRLTDLDPASLPAAGPFAGVPAVVSRDGDDFRIFFGQEYADHVAAAAIDAHAGLA